MRGEEREEEDEEEESVQNRTHARCAIPNEEEEEEFITSGNWRGKRNSMSRGAGADQGVWPHHGGAVRRGSERGAEGSDKGTLKRSSTRVRTHTYLFTLTLTHTFS